MDFVIKYRWALAGTIFLHLILLVSAFNIKVSQPPFHASQLTRIPVLLAPPEEEPKTQEQLEQEKLAQENNGKILNETVNETDKRSESDKKYDARDFNNLNDKVDQNVKDLEKQYFDEFASKRKTEPIEKKETPENKNNKSENTDDPGNTSKDLNIKGTVTSSYNLGGRTHERIAKPSYTCKSGGTVTVNIKVDRSGRVIEARINQRSSSYTEECLGENAIKYAYKSKFIAGTQYDDPQSGTITYNYVAQ